MALALLTLTLEIPMSEFLELQSLPTEARRTRLNLPETCVPAMTAVSSISRKKNLLILVTCRHDGDGAGEPGSPKTAQKKLP